MSQALFNHMSQEHGLTLLESEMHEIELICRREESNPQVGTCCICGAAIWRHEAHMSDNDRGMFHPICSVRKERDDLRAERAKLVEGMKEAAALIKDLITALKTCQEYAAVGKVLPPEEYRKLFPL